jgi:formylglycine-generating enzyme required for sulfatase activity
MRLLLIVLSVLVIAGCGSSTRKSRKPAKPAPQSTEQADPESETAPEPEAVPELEAAPEPEAQPATEPAPAPDAAAPATEPVKPTVVLGQDNTGRVTDLTVGNAAQRFRWVNAGSFTMGSPMEDGSWRGADEAQHQVTLTKGFWLAETECTQALWLAVMGANPSQKADTRLPVDTVSWEQAQIFIQRLNNRFPGLKARLPTETEWEYACRAGSKGPFATAKDEKAEALGWFAPNAAGKVHPVRQKRANAWGFFDMHGNVAEWCLDGYALYPATATDPFGTTNNAYVSRGGSWRDQWWKVRSAARQERVPTFCDNAQGFRLALAADSNLGRGR